MSLGEEGRRMTLKGKVAIVTGGARGLGAAVSRGLAERGANVIVNYAHSRAEAEATVQKLREHGADAVAVRGDVGVDADWRSIAEAAPARALGPEIRINAVCPGFMATRRFSDALGQEGVDDRIQRQQAATPLKRA